MDIDANINIEIDDDDIVGAVEYKLERLVSRLIKDEIGDVDSAIESWVDNASLHDYIDWDSARMCGYLDAVSDEEIDRLVKTTLNLWGRDWIRPIIQEEITKWVRSLGNVFANMTHEYNTRENHSE